MKKILYITNIFPHYRFAIWKKLLNSKKFNLEIYFSQKNPLGIYSPELKVIFSESELSKLHIIKNYWFKKKILIWQSHIIKTLFFSQYDHVMILGEMNVISSWISIFIAKLRGKKVFIWSHGIYGNESYSKNFFRKLFLKQADFIFLYENRAKLLLQENGFHAKSIEVVYNSLDYDLFEKLYRKLKGTDKSNVINFFKNSSLLTIIFIGRITKIKKAPLLIEAVNILNQSKIKYNLLIVGGGTELNFLKKKYLKSTKMGWIHFYGSCYDNNRTSELIYHSDLCVSPGNIGLTAIHSLSFGTPVVSHDNFENQMPEVEAIIDGENGFLFKENNSNDLANKIEKWFLTNSNIDKDFIRKIILEKYNPENQLSIFENRFSNG